MAWLSTSVMLVFYHMLSLAWVVYYDLYGLSRRSLGIVGVVGAVTSDSNEKC